MGTSKKKNTRKKSSGKMKKDPILGELTPQQWARLKQKETLFPEKLARANEMLAKIKFMDE